MSDRTTDDEHTSESNVVVPEVRLVKEEDTPPSAPGGIWDIQVGHEWMGFGLWWKWTVSLALASVLIVFVGTGLGLLHLSDNVLIAYAASVAGSSSILAISGAYILSPFRRWRDKSDSA